MRFVSVVAACAVLAAGLFAGAVWAKDAPDKLSQYRFIEMPQPSLDPPEIGGSMFQAAAANSVELGWYQFDNPNGTPNAQGWVNQDITVQDKKYWHVAGTPCTDAITPVAGTKSMWCGQAPSGAAPWCGWATLPGYGNNWDQSLESTVSNITALAYSIMWDSEPGYDYSYLEWWDAANSQWVADATVNAGAGGYDGGPLTLVEATTPVGAGLPALPTKARFHFVSDSAWSDQDGLWPTTGAVMVDNISINGGVAEGFEAAVCNAQTVGPWTATIPPGFGAFGALYLATGVVQEDPCRKPLSNLWGWFDNPLTTNYACGGWPSQGAMRYGPDTNGLYMLNEIYSPWMAIQGLGSEYILTFLTYRDLPLNTLQFYVWAVRTKAGDQACPTGWRDFNYVFFGGQKDWLNTAFQVGAFVGASDTHIQVNVGAYDMCGVWGGIYGDCACHSHAPLIDQVKLQHVETYGPQYTSRSLDMWQDNFPEDGSITGYARCDMAADMIPNSKPNLVPGDSLKIAVTDPNGLGTDNTGGRPGKAVYVFVKCTDRFGNARPYTGTQMQSPDNTAYTGDANAGLLRWPLVTLPVTPTGWNAYRLDYAFTTAGGEVKDTFCGDLMDLAAGPDGPPYHSNENWAANTGIFVPGDVIWYFFGAKNTLNQYSYLGRDYNGQGVGDGPQFRTNNIMDLAGTDVNGLPKAACEWSVLPDAGRQPGDLGDILYVDDADGWGTVQLYFDWAFQYYGLTDRVDRFDVLGPASAVGSNLASRVKSIQNQIIGDPVEIYQKVLWNSAQISAGLMGDGGTPNGGSGADKSDDFGLCYTFLNQHPNNPGWAYWGDNTVEDWATLIGAGAVNVKSTFMNHTLMTGDQRTLTGFASPRVYPASPLPPAPWLRPAESFYAYGGCPSINDFDSPGQAGNSRVAHRYANASTGPAAALSQWTVNAVNDTARFYLAGFGYNFIRDDDMVNPPDYAPHLREILRFFANEVGQPIGIDPVAFENRLDNAYPNPFNPTTTIKYAVAEAGQVTLKIYNAAGQLVRTLVNEEKAPVQGGFTATWNGLNDHGAPVASGVYFYQLTAKNFSQTKKMVLLK